PPFGRFTARPIAVRDSDAANPVSPSSGISVDGMVSELASDADVAFARRCHEKRSSFNTRGVRLLVTKTDMAWVRDTLWVVRPGGVACPPPPCSLSLNR